MKSPEKIAEDELSLNVQTALKTTRNIIKTLDAEVRMHVEAPWDEMISYSEMTPIIFKETLRTLNNMTLEQYKNEEL